MRIRVALLAAVSAFAGDLTGIWTGQLPGRNGAMIDVAFKLTQTGSLIGGKQYGDYQSARIVEGKIDGDQVVFVVVTPEQAGNQVNETRYRFTGTLKNGELELTRERERSSTAGNGAGAQVRPDTKQTLKLKRLL